MAARKFAVQIVTYADGHVYYVPVKRVLGFWCDLYPAATVTCSTFEEALKCIDGYKALEARLKHVSTVVKEVPDAS